MVGEKKTKLMLYSTQLKLKLKLELSLAKNCCFSNEGFPKTSANKASLLVIYIIKIVIIIVLQKL